MIVSSPTKRGAPVRGRGGSILIVNFVEKTRKKRGRTVMHVSWCVCTSRRGGKFRQAIGSSAKDSFSSRFGSRCSRHGGQSRVRARTLLSAVQKLRHVSTTCVANV